jgi:hypothetical protein
VTDNVFEQAAGGAGMDTTEKTFRYSHIFKYFGVLYFVFLAIVGLLSYFARDLVILTVLGITLGFGILLWILFRTYSIQVSDRGITQKTLLGTKSLAWGDIRQISAQGAALRIRGDHVTISISPRMYGSMEITQWLQTKRPGLFRIKHVAQLRHNSVWRMPVLWVGILQVILFLLLYIFRDYVSYLLGIVGLFFCGQALVSWYISPRSLVLEGNSIIVRYRNRSVSYSADDIAGIQAWMTKQGQFRSVVIALHNKKVLDLSVFQQTPFITFPVLSQWHEESAKNAGVRLSKPDRQNQGSYSPHLRTDR